MREIHEIDTFRDYLDRQGQLSDCVVQGLDIGEVENQHDWQKVEVDGAIFLGCSFPSASFKERLRERGALIFPPIKRIPYQAFRPKLYQRSELMDGWTAEKDQSLDKRIYDHFVAKGRHTPNVLEALSQRLHDFSIDDALGDLLSGRVDGGDPKEVVAIMGGHGTSRTDPWYRKVVEVARSLSRRGFFVTSGGGPGMMEATNLGAWLSNGEDGLLDKAIEILSSAPVYTHKDYINTANQVLELHPNGAESLAIPTWFYGHEPSNAFSTWIAKYFSNSLREDGLLAIASHGVVFAPGSAGTTQEVFQDACQNHYGTFENVSPMVFLNKTHYQKNGVYSTLEKLANDRQYKDFLAISDAPEEVVEFIVSHPPEKYSAAT